jgi:hypothetical protein
MNHFNEALQKSIDFLNSKEASDSLRRDVYWPKWDSTWWHILLLYELGMIREVPKDLMELFAEVVNDNVLHFFPFTEDEFPKDTDPYRQILCFCAAGSLYQMLYSYGIDVDKKIPWLRAWFTKYQLPDGGYNCNEDAYTKEVKKSSMTSTLPMVESLLLFKKDQITSDELDVLHKASDYIVSHKLFRKLTDQSIMDPNFTQIRFPRYYEYDFLRGFTFLYSYREKYGYTFPDSITDEVEELVNKHLVDGIITLKGVPLYDKSYNPLPNGKWEKGEASTYDLLKLVMETNHQSLVLTKAWNLMKPKYLKVIKGYQRSTEYPVFLSRGENVDVLKKDNEQGWFLFKNSNGVEGWAPLKILNGSMITKNYDSTELTVVKGDILKVYYEETNWYWCKNQEGLKGFVPKKNLEVS